MKFEHNPNTKSLSRRYHHQFITQTLYLCFMLETDDPFELLEELLDVSVLPEEPPFNPLGLIETRGKYPSPKPGPGVGGLLALLVFIAASGL